MAVISGAQVAALVIAAGFPANVHVTMVAIAKAESGWNTTAVNNSNSNGSVDRGLFQINSVHRFDAGRLLSDAKYNTECAKRIYSSQGLGAWSVYNSGKWKQFEAEARQAVAQADNVAGSPVLPGGGSGGGEDKPAVTYGPPGPEYTNAGVGTPTLAARETSNALAGLKIVGSDFGGDYSSTVIGAPRWEGGIEIVPNLTVTLADPEGDMLWRHRNVWVPGSHVTYQDLDMRVDNVEFEPGGHGTGQLTVTCVDDIVWALRHLKGARTAAGISATTWLAQEMQLAGIDPNRWLLGESVPTQSEIARDVADQTGQASSADEPSAWTTAVRLARELGKRIFVSGRRLVFGSSEFAMRWCAPGDVRLSWHGLSAGEQFLSMPSASTTAIGDRQVAQVTGRVPLNRAKYFRPGVGVILRQVPAVVGDEWKQFMVARVAHDLATDVDGAEIELLQPVDPKPEPPTSSAARNGGPPGNGAPVSGGGADGQIDKFVALALQQQGDQYVYGATPAAGNPDPRQFDCSSLVQWAAGRVGITGVPRTSESQEAHCRARGTLISVQAGVNTKGALLFHPGHVAISLGNGKTIEAMNSRQGITQGNANGRGWNAAGKLPGAQGYRG